MHVKGLGRYAVLSRLTERRCALLIVIALLIQAQLAACGAHALTSDQIVPGSGGTPQAGAEVVDLKQGNPIARNLAGGQAHSYWVTLSAGQHVRVVAVQRGIDVVVTFFDLNEKTVAEVDSPNYISGPEPISLIANTSGKYRLELRSPDREATSGSYDLRIEELRAARPEDYVRFAAQTAYRDAVKLQNRFTAEQLRQALDKQLEALGKWRTGGDRIGEANSLVKLGEINLYLGDKRKALEYLHQALTLRLATKDRVGEANSLNTIGVSHFELGENQQALDYYHQALLVLQSLPIRDPRTEATIVNNIALIHSVFGEGRQALTYFHQALQLFESVTIPGAEALTLNNIGTVHMNLGERKRALEFFEKAERLSRQGRGDQRTLCYALSNIGYVHFQLGARVEALKYLDEALLKWRSLGDPSGEATAKSNIGLVYHFLPKEDKSAAAKYYNEALALLESTRNPRVEARTLVNLGLVYSDLGDNSKAMECYRRALELMRSIRDRAGEALALYSVARLERDCGNLDTARATIADALKIIESLRTNISGPDMRSSYFSTVRNVYELAVDILMQLHKKAPGEGFADLALQTSERARARSLLEVLNRSEVLIRQRVDPKLAERERFLQRELDGKYRLLSRLLSGKYSKDDVESISTEIERARNEYQDLQVRIELNSPHYAAITQPKAVGTETIQRELLDEDTVLLEFLLGEPRSYVWAVTRTTIKSHELPGRGMIEAAARRALGLLTQRGRPLKNETPKERQARLTNEARGDSEYWDAARDLSEMVLGSVVSELGKRRLVIVADGALEYIPFAALPSLSEDKKDGNALNPLVEQHEVVNLPSVSTLGVLRKETAGRKLAPKMVAVLADPVFGENDVRLLATGIRPWSRHRSPRARESRINIERSLADMREEESAEGLGRLRYSRFEAREIMKLVQRADRMAALDFDASKPLAVGDKLASFRIVHFATHGPINSTRPELSGIVLSLVDRKGLPQDGFLRLDEIYNLNLPAELVVLSACDTGLGKEVRGEGLVGLTRGFMYAGAPRVVASLWKVRDSSTMEFVKRFYGRLLKGGLSPSAALREAQLEMWRQTQWKSPYFWAPFVLQGDWRWH